MRNHFARHRLGERDNPALGGAIVRRARQAGGSGDGAKIYYPAGFFGDHYLERFAREVESAVEMDSEHLVPDFVAQLSGGFGEALGPRDAGVVDQHVDGAELGDEVANNFLGRGALRHVSH